MTTLQRIRDSIPDMTAAERAEWPQLIARDIGGVFPGIESVPGVMGGEPCVVRTRIPAWLLVQGRIFGMSEAEILSAYPVLRAEDFSNAWAYYRANKEEIERQIADHEMAWRWRV